MPSFTTPSRRAAWIDWPHIGAPASHRMTFAWPSAAWSRPSAKSSLAPRSSRPRTPEVLRQVLIGTGSRGECPARTDKAAASNRQTEPVRLSEVCLTPTLSDFCVRPCFESTKSTAPAETTVGAAPKAGAAPVVYGFHFSGRGPSVGEVPAGRTHHGGTEARRRRPVLKTAAKKRSNKCRSDWPQKGTKKRRAKRGRPRPKNNGATRTTHSVFFAFSPPLPFCDNRSLWETWDRVVLHPLHSSPPHDRPGQCKGNPDSQHHQPRFQGRRNGNGT